MPEIYGQVFDIQKFSIHDGPGIRTAVFLKGCPLRCRWCHNPESIARRPHLSFDPGRCIGCGACLKACPRRVHGISAGRKNLRRDGCRLCGACAAACHALALEIVGRRMTVAGVMEKVVQDIAFYRHTGGGLTLTGGEPAWQARFALALLKAAHQRGIHTAIETCGYGAWRTFKAMLPVCRLFLFDIKAEPALHRRLTGVPFDSIGDNLRHLHDAGAAIWLRLPLVPGLNDTDARFAHVAKLLRSLPGIQAVEVMPYHDLGREKQARMDLPDRLPAGIRRPSDEQIKTWLERLSALGVHARLPA